jgi:hypothetical protein
MSKLFGYIFILIGTSIAGVAVIIALTSGKDSGTEIAIAAGLGALVGLAAAWIVTNKITALR